MQMLDVLICDDHPIFREGLVKVLEGTVNIVGEASTGKECLAQMHESLPDIILLDIRMPEMNGIECLQQIRKQNKEVKVLAITQFDEKRLVGQMMKYGANGYLLKHTTVDELKNAFARVMNGKTYCTPEIDIQSIEYSGPKEGDKLFPDISDREKQVIRLICDEHSNKQIASILGISIKTVELHRSNIFRKVGVSNSAGLVRWAMENDFLIE